jgi:hypothetical protein
MAPARLHRDVQVSHGLELGEQPDGFGDDLGLVPRRFEDPARERQDVSASSTANSEKHLGWALADHVLGNVESKGEARRESAAPPVELVEALDEPRKVDRGEQVRGAMQRAREARGARTD